MKNETGLMFTYNKVEYFDMQNKRSVEYAEVTGYNGRAERVEIPCEIDGITVKAVAHGAFSGCGFIKSVKIPNTVRDICFEAFSDCVSLECVQIPKSVTYIGNRAFCGCKSLKFLSLPSSVEIIGDKALGYSDIQTKTEGFLLSGKKLSAVYKYAKANRFDFEKTGERESPFTYSVERVYDRLSDRNIRSACITNYCGNDENVIVPSEIDGYPVKIIDGCAFAKTCVKTVIIPEGTEKILSGAFRGCKKLESVFLPNTLEFIGSYAFSGCERLAKISVPKNAEVGAMAFDTCA